MRLSWRLLLLPLCLLGIHGDPVHVDPITDACGRCGTQLCHCGWC